LGFTRFQTPAPTGKRFVTGFIGAPSEDSKTGCTETVEITEPNCVCGVPWSKCKIDNTPHSCDHSRIVYVGTDGEPIRFSCHGCGMVGLASDMEKLDALVDTDSRDS